MRTRSFQTHREGRHSRSIVSVCLGCVLLSALIGLLLLLAVYGIPARLMQDECYESFPVLLEENTYPLDTYSGRTLDNFTDSTMFLEAAYTGEESVLEQAVNVYSARLETSSNPYTSFVSIYSENGESTAPYEYARYWHGYLVFLRPLFAKLNYPELRQLNLIVQYTLLLVLLCLIQKRQPSFLLPFLLTVLFLAPTAIGRVLEYSSVYYILLLFLLLLLWNPKGRITEENVWLLFLFAGIATAYFDYLTAPTLTLTIPLCLLYVRRAGRGTWKQNAALFLRCCFVWGFGYAGMWGAKWILALLFQGRDFLSSLGKRMWLYTGPSIRGHIVTPLRALQINLQELFKDRDLVVLCAGLACLLLAAAVCRRRHIDRKCLADALWVLLPVLIPLVWTIVLKNHVKRHYWFTYRTLTPLILCPLCALSVLAAKGRKTP